MKKSNSPTSIEALRKVRYLTLTTINEEGQEEKVRVDVVKELRVSEASLMRGVEEQAEQVMFWGLAKQRLLHVVRAAERHLELQESRLWLSYRYDKDEKGEKYTDAYLQRLVHIDERYTDAKAALDTARHNLGLASAICDALENRRFMLMQMRKEIADSQ